MLEIALPTPPIELTVSVKAPAVCVAWAGLVKALIKNIIPTPAAMSGTILDQTTIVVS